LDEIKVGMCRQKYNLRRGTGIPQSIGCLYPFEFRHRNVSNDHIRLQVPGSFDQNAPENIEGWLEETSG